MFFLQTNEMNEQNEVKSTDEVTNICNVSISIQLIYSRMNVPSNLT